MTIIDNIDISVLLKAKGWEDHETRNQCEENCVGDRAGASPERSPHRVHAVRIQKAERLASIKTVPYSPSSDEIQEAVTCDTTDNGTVPNG